MKTQTKTKAELFSITQSTLVLILTYTLLLLIPDAMLVGDVNLPIYLVAVSFNILFYLSLSYMICIIGRLGGKVFGKVSHFVWHVVIYFFSVSNVFLFVFFGICWDAFTLELVNETNQAEASGFIATYFTNAKFYWLLLLYTAIAITETTCLRRATDKVISLGKLKWMAITILVLMLCHIVVFSTDYEWNYNIAHGTPIKRNMLWKLEQSVLIFTESQKDYDVCAASQAAALVDSCSHRSPTIIVLIGESHIKHHSSLYGYTKDTNPLLSKEPNLFIFNDVVAPYNLTSECFKLFLSMASVGDKTRWCEAPLFPTLFKKAGYHVTFYSSQFVRVANLDRFDAKAGFFFHPAIAPYIIDDRNMETPDYDQGLIDQYKRDREQIENHPYQLIFFHFLGQHINAKDKYPKNFSYFCAKDYPERTELDEDLKQEVAEYDNATRYNDYIIEQIINMYREKDAIIIYFADHGDEANDYRPKIGRSFDFSKMNAKGVHCQFDIPFLIYTSDLYRQNHPDIIGQIAASTDRRFMTDDLPHLLLYLAGISCEWYKPQRNLISPDYRNDRPRLIGAEQIDYDEFCSTH